LRHEGDNNEATYSAGFWQGNEELDLKSGEVEGTRERRKRRGSREPAVDGLGSLGRLAHEIWCFWPMARKRGHCCNAELAGHGRHNSPSCALAHLAPSPSRANISPADVSVRTHLVRLAESSLSRLIFHGSILEAAGGWREAHQ